jgi:hypothetical protein
MANALSDRFADLFFFRGALAVGADKELRATLAGIFALMTLRGMLRDA